MGRIPVERGGLDRQERVVAINSVARVAKDGRRISSIALVVGEETELVGKSISEILAACQQAGDAPAEVGG